MYNYVFDKENCWYKDVCIHPKNNTCNDSCIRYMEMDYLMYHSQIPKKRQYSNYLTPENIDYSKFLLLADIKDDIVSFVNRGDNLYITSKFTGNGKTSWAIKLMLRYFGEIWSGNGFKVRGVFINVPMFLTQLKANISDNSADFNKMVKSLYEVDLVIWDDIASYALTSYEHSQLLAYIDHRVLSGKSNIFTGNIPERKDLESAIGVRLASRVLEGTVVEFEGRDRR